jgi:hypothetical protein
MTKIQNPKRLVIEYWNLSFGIWDGAWNLEFYK